MTQQTPFFEEVPQGAGEAGAQAELRRERLRFTSFSFKRSPSGHCTADVTLEWHEGQLYCGRSEGVCSQYADLRLAAEAAIKALKEFARDSVSLELVGVKALRAFDANVVIVSVLCKSGGQERRLLGCHLADENLLRSAVLATLQATNRVLGLIARD